MTPTLLSPLLLSIVFLFCVASVAALIHLLLRAKAQAFVLLRDSGTLREQLSGLTALQSATAEQLGSVTKRAATLECEMLEERRRGAEATEQLRAEAARSLEALRDAKGALEQRAATLQSTLQARESELADRDRNFTELRAQLAFSGEEHETSKRELATAREKLSGQSQRIAELEKRELELREVRSELQRTVAKLHEAGEREATLATQLEDERRLSAEKLDMTQTLHSELEEKFKGLAAQVLERNTEKFESSTKLRLGEMAEALRGHVKELEQKISLSHEKDSSDRVALRTELQHMVEASKRIDQDAANLTRALKGDRRVQGAWGEVVLESILEQCGLREGHEYQKQISFSGEEEGRLRPDVVVQLPGSRSIVVDSKVSLTAYSEYVAAADDASAERAIERHLVSLRTHVKQLSQKEYWRLNGLESCDFVFMFVPVESALVDAIRNDKALFAEAFAKRVILTGPTTLLATLRTIEHTWRVERYNQSARQIVEDAGGLYDKFVSFVGDLEDVGKQLESANKSFDKARNKLSSGHGNLVRRVTRLRDHGAKVKKELPRELVETAVDGSIAVQSEQEAADLLQ